MRRLSTLGGALALGLGALLLLGAFQPPPAPTRWVTDPDGALSAPTRERLDQRLEAYQQATGHQVIVWIGRSTGDVPLEDWAARTFEAWGVGQKKLDDGVAVFVFMQDRHMRIEVGYGLEPVVPDAVASRIIREVAVPRLRAGDVDGAVSGSVDALLARISGEAPAPTNPQLPQLHVSPAQLVLLVIVAVILLAFAITHPRLAMFLLFNLLSGNSRRGGSSGGGFSGGGGRSGGGGASGSW
ncbi:MAG: TPM domain-containing protein [Deltaproteobacteria bacterium]|nr:TPM domain-containing protein [Deltaproteobacteria bacterium]